MDDQVFDWAGFDWSDVVLDGEWDYWIIFETDGVVLDSRDWPIDGMLPPYVSDRNIDRRKADNN